MATKNMSIVKQPKETSKSTRLRKKPNYKSFRLHKTIKHTAPPLPGWWSLLKKSLSLMTVNRKHIFVFFMVYGFLNLLLVRGFSSPVDIEGIRESFNELVDESTSNLATGFTAFGLLINTSVQGSSDVAQTYQSMLLVVASLAIIWLYRQQQAGNSVNMKMAFYRGMYPLIPFILVLSVIGLQMLPALAGNFLYTSVIEAGLAVGRLEQTLWLLFFLSTLLLSLYMISSSAIALYIVTLPEMTPFKALRQARDLVRFRRFSILVRTILVAIVVVVVMFAVVLPVIFFAPTLAEWMFFSITVLSVPLVHGYLFSLYRELL